MLNNICNIITKVLLHDDCTVVLSVPEQNMWLSLQLYQSEEAVKQQHQSKIVYYNYSDFLNAKIQIMTKKSIEKAHKVVIEKCIF